MLAKRRAASRILGGQTIYAKESICSIGFVPDLWNRLIFSPGAANQPLERSGEVCVALWRDVAEKYGHH